MIEDPLAPFRAAYPACELVVLFDLSARTVLTAHSALRVGQEQLDALLNTASGLLSGDDGPSGTAILAGPTGSRVFVPSTDGSAEALAAVFPPGADLTGVTDDLAALLDAPEIAQTGA